MTSMTPSDLKAAPDRKPAARRWAAPFRFDRAGAQRVSGRILGEPLFHFLVVGLALFVAGGVYQSQTNLHRIVITPAHVNQLANDYALQYGERPDATTLTALLQRDIHDEILFRQGVALKLDKGDEIVRRRVVQKMQFLIQDLHPPAEPSDAELQTYYAAHAAHYETPAKVSFSHIYFSSDKAGDAAARARAEAVLRTLPAGATRAPDRGDPFPDLYDFSAYEPEQIYRLFGHTPFADAALSAPAGHWAGPFRSGYGWHLLYVDDRKALEHPPLSAVREAVRTDYLQEAQDKANDAGFARLAKDFQVVRADKAAAP